MRIVSLLASATEIVVELGLEDQLVAISHECDYPSRVLDRPRISRPRFDPEGLTSGEIDRAVREAMLEYGSVYEVDTTRLEEVRPDLILTQAVCEVCAVPTPGVEELVRERGIGAQILSLDAHTLDEIFETILQVGDATRVPERAERLVAGYRSRLARVGEAVQHQPRPRVLAVEWLEPPFAPGHWTPEMVERAGGENLVGTTGATSIQLSWDDLAGHDPDVLIVMPCGYDLEESRVEADRHEEALRGIADRAIDSGRAFVVDGSSYFNRSGPRAVDGVEILAGLLHPDYFEPPSEGAEVWEDRAD